MKRQRGRTPRKPGNPSQRVYESNGPDTKIRGSASQIYDKYIQLSRDCLTSGNRVKSENHLQHAEHYFRIVRAQQPPPAREGYASHNEAPKTNGHAATDQHTEPNKQGPDRQGNEAPSRNISSENKKTGPHKTTANPLEMVTFETKNLLPPSAEKQPPARKRPPQRRPRPEATTEANEALKNNADKSP